MVTKREFITGAASVAAASAASWAQVAAAAGAAGAQSEPRAPAAGGGRGDGADAREAAATADAAAGSRPQLVVFNERYADARAFAEVFAARGIPTVPIAGDMGTLWYGSLRRRVAAGETRIAGIGTPTDLFILRELGREARLKLTHEGLHDCRGCGTLTHTVRGCAGPAGIAGCLEAGAGEWAAALAGAMIAGSSLAQAGVQPEAGRAMTAGAGTGPIASAGAPGAQDGAVRVTPAGAEPAGPAPRRMASMATPPGRAGTVPAAAPGARAASMPAAPAAAGAADIIIRTGAAARLDHPGMLVSWILA